MQDLTVSQNLKALAAESAKGLRALVDSGEEIPFELSEGGEGSVLCSYEPLTARFVRDHAAALRGLDAFATTREAIETAGLAPRYLEAMGVPVPAEAERRAEVAVLAFLCRLWDGCSEFQLDSARLDEAMAELNETAAPSSGCAEVVVPVIGLQLPVGRVQLAEASLVRADLVDVPHEARESQQRGAADWEPVFVAATEVDLEAALRGRGDVADEPDPVAAVFHRLITTLRIFRPGSVALGPHAWVRTGSDRWRRIGTGAGRARQGAYHLAEDEIGALVDFARRIDAQPGRLTALRRAVSRFEAGLERRLILDSLNDHLIALRFLLEGDGPAGTGLPMRVAALCAEPAGRQAVKDSVERALLLERALWSGEPGQLPADHAPARVAGEIEDLTRTILRRAIAGELGTDMRTVADDLLLGDGLSAGSGSDADLGGTDEWGAIENDEELAEAGEDSEHEGETDDHEPDPDPDPDPGDAVPVEDELELTDADDGEGVIVQSDDRNYETAEIEADAGRETASEPVRLGWLEEIAAEVGESSMDFPARKPVEQDPGGEEADPRARTRSPEQKAARVAFLFPSPDTTEWQIGELDRRRAS